jgi:hypothetical protein
MGMEASDREFEGCANCWHLEHTAETTKIIFNEETKFILIEFNPISNVASILNKAITYPTATTTGDLIGTKVIDRDIHLQLKASIFKTASILRGHYYGRFLINGVYWLIND